MAEKEQGLAEAAAKEASEKAKTDAKKAEIDTHRLANEAELAQLDECRQGVQVFLASSPLLRNSQPVN